MALSTQTKTSVAIGFGILVAGLVVGAIIATASHGGRRTVVHWQADGGDTPPAGNIVCVQQTGVGMAPALALFGLDGGAGAPYAYALCRACAVQLDASTPEPNLPAGITALETTQAEVDFDGGAQFWCVLQGEPELPCACSTGNACSAVTTDGGTAVAATGATLAAGSWSGAGCFSKVCIELAGFDSWPAECPR